MPFSIFGNEIELFKYSAEIGFHKEGIVLTLPPLKDTADNIFVIELKK